MAISLVSHLAYHTLSAWDRIRLVIDQVFRRLSGASPDTRLVGIYRTLLQRKPDAGALNHFLPDLKSIRGMSWLWGPAPKIWGSPEYALRLHKRVHKRFPTTYRRPQPWRPLRLPPIYLQISYAIAHHEARRQLIKDHLSQAIIPKTVLDLGGGSAASPDGALLGMEYPHIPDMITIIDLPPNTRVASSKSSLNESSHRTSDGIEIRFIHGSFVDLSPLPDASFDLIYSGQTIEHISLDDARKVLTEARRVLKPNGRLCLDTPNRLVTRLLNSKGFIHDEHQHEYEPDELIALLHHHGFECVTRLAVSPVPKSRSSRRFDYHELITAPAVGEHYHDGFSFYLECQLKNELFEH